VSVICMGSAEDGEKVSSRAVVGSPCTIRRSHQTRATLMAPASLASSILLVSFALLSLLPATVESVLAPSLGI
jgi:hypothetical protein